MKKYTLEDLDKFTEARDILLDLHGWEEIKGLWMTSIPALEECGCRLCQAMKLIILEEVDTREDLLC